MTDPLVRTCGLGKAYLVGGRWVQALEGVTVDIAPGEFVAVTGASGSGKSTFLSLIGCLARPSVGSLELAGVDIATLDATGLADLRNRMLGFVFQSYHLLPRSTAFENVELPLVYRGMPRDERRRRALMALEAMGLARHVERWPSQLSGGEQQRVAIARAIVGGPRLLLADEPTGALDSRTGQQILAIFRALHQAGVAIVLSTHDPEMARRADRVLVFADGRLESDTPRLPVGRPARADAVDRPVLAELAA